jgi:hypothetical protein
LSLNSSLAITTAGGLGDFKSKISANNIEFLDYVYILPGDGFVYEYEILTDTFVKMSAFQPTPFDVKFVGFNVLAENPLTFIADQGITNKSIQGVFLTVEGNKPVQSIPGGEFQINVIHTGTNFTVDEVGLKFFVEFETAQEQEIFPRLIKAQDVGGLFIFTFNAGVLSKFTGKELSIYMFELDKTTGSNITANVGPGSVVSGETTISVGSTSMFAVEKDFLLSQTGVYESVRVKQIVDSTTLKIYGALTNSYATAETARLFVSTRKKLQI